MRPANAIVRSAMVVVAFGLGMVPTWCFAIDKPCAQIATFASSIAPGEKHAVRYEAMWGAEPTWSCEAQGYAPGQELCRWLMNHASQEYMADNVWAMLTCNGQGRGGIITERLSGSLLLTRMQGVDRDVSVMIEFSTHEGVPFLMLSAERPDEAPGDPR